MSLKYDLELQSVYNFSMKAGALLGYSYDNATVLALLDFASANAIQDVTPLHMAAYAELGAGVPRNPRDLIYVKIRTSTGVVRVIAMDWIATQPELVTSNTVRITVSEVNLSDIAVLREILLVNGFTKTTIEVIQEPEGAGV